MSRIFKMSLYPMAAMASTINPNERALYIPLSINIIANIPRLAVIPYRINTVCFGL
ncbi:MAG: hypothetical protein FWC68_03910 [Oscillospiraceae bacterium]|nr:hypothetical protein [Oscillospiraceae bacterium]